MWIGVARGLASFEFSVSPSSNGFWVVKVNITIITIKNGVKSLAKKYGWNVILSQFVWLPIGFEDPVWCNIIKCTKTIANKIIGIKKCKAKNRVKVGCDTENPPHNQLTNGLPK